MLASVLHAKLLFSSSSLTTPESFLGFLILRNKKNQEQLTYIFNFKSNSWSGGIKIALFHVYINEVNNVNIWFCVISRSIYKAIYGSKEFSQFFHQFISILLTFKILLSLFEGCHCWCFLCHLISWPLMCGPLNSVNKLHGTKCCV